MREEMREGERGGGEWGQVIRKGQNNIDPFFLSHLRNLELVQSWHGMPQCQAPRPF